LVASVYLSLYIFVWCFLVVGECSFSILVLGLSFSPLSDIGWMSAASPFTLSANGHLRATLQLVRQEDWVNLTLT
jgi:hypothetical protein